MSGLKALIDDMKTVSATGPVIVSQSQPGALAEAILVESMLQDDIKETQGIKENWQQREVIRKRLRGLVNDYDLKKEDDFIEFWNTKIYPLLLSCARAGKTKKDILVELGKDSEERLTFLKRFCCWCHEKRSVRVDIADGPTFLQNTIILTFDWS